MRVAAAASARAERVCIYRIGNIGDTACAIPAMHAIRRAYPAAHLTLVTSPGKLGSVGARELLDGVSWIDEIVVYHAEDIATARGRLELVRNLRARRFDIWIELPAVAAPLVTLYRNLMVARSAGARWGFGWQYEPRFAAQAQSLFLEFPDEVERLLEIVRAGGFAGGDAEFPLELSDSNRRTVTDLLGEAGVDKGAAMIAFAPGAKLEPNRWPVDRFIEVGINLAARGYAIVVLGGASDAPMCEKIAKQIGRNAASLAGKTTRPRFVRSARALRDADLQRLRRAASRRRGWHAVRLALHAARISRDVVAARVSACSAVEERRVPHLLSRRLPVRQQMHQGDRRR